MVISFKHNPRPPLPRGATSALSGQPLFTRGQLDNNGIAIPLPTNEANREKTNYLQAALARDGHTFTITPVSLPVDAAANERGGESRAGPGNRYALAERVAKLFDKEVVWITAKGDFDINGVVVPGGRLSGQVFVNAHSYIPANVILGHELSYHMEKDVKAVYTTLKNALTGMLKNYPEYRKKASLPDSMSNEDAAKEMIGDLLGDNFDNPVFWNRVAEYSSSKGSFSVAAWPSRRCFNPRPPLPRGVTVAAHLNDAALGTLFATR
ncbi:MAG: hypothetical protein V4500_12075 [Pseudomonadota bacterium]